MSASQVAPSAAASQQQQNPQQGDNGAVHPVLSTPPPQWTTNLTASTLTSSAAGNSCLDEQIERLKRCEYLREGEVKALCLRAREILVDESNVQRVDAPVTVRFLLLQIVVNNILKVLPGRERENILISNLFQ